MSTKSTGLSRFFADKARRLITSVAEAGHPLIVAWSAGKDSTCVLVLVLSALREMAQRGSPCPPLIVMHADTLVENPEMAIHAQREMAAIRAYADKFGLDVRIKVSTPSLLSQWVVKVVGGRNLPVFANKGTRDCTVDLKITPMGRLKKAVMKGIKAQWGLPPVTILGTRFSESPGRKKRMLERGENAEDVWSDTEGLKLSPIADWDDAVLWDYLYACAEGLEESYNDCSELVRIYMAGTEETCMSGETEIPSCRFGCSICTVGRDRSMEAMLIKGGRYAYMQPLYDLQRFLVNTQYDLSRRQWVGRSIKEGRIAIAPDVYSPAMLEELLRCMLTIDIREKETAMRLGIEPRFELVSAKALVAIDAIWSQQGIHKAFHALSIYRDVYEYGERYDLPELAEVHKTGSIPEPRYIEVGKAWEDRGGKYEFCGLRDPILEMASEQGTGCMGHKELPDGRIVLDAETSESSFDIDDEAISFILGMELDYLIGLGESMPRNYGFRHYITLGAINLAKSQFGKTDIILRRTSFKEFEGLFDMSPEELLELAEKYRPAAGTVVKLETSRANNAVWYQPDLLAA